MLEEFELVLGPGGSDSVFPSEEARRAAWEEHRDELLAAFTRPWAAAQYDEPEDEDLDPDEDAAPWSGSAG